MAVPTAVFRYPPVPHMSGQDDQHHQTRRDEQRHLEADDQHPSSGSARSVRRASSSGDSTTAGGSCCCAFLGITVGTAALGLAFMYVENLVESRRVSSLSINIIVFFLTFLMLIVFILFVARRLSLRRMMAQRGTSQTTTSAVPVRESVSEEVQWDQDGSDPPPYHEVVQQPTHQAESPPPDYEHVKKYMVS